MKRAACWLSLGACALAACGGDGVNGVGVMQPPRAATFREVQDTVFTPSCALAALGCHAGPAPPLGMSLADGDAYAAIVLQPSIELAGFVRVAPGNATDSYLFMKITGDPRIAGSPMPLLGGPLSSEQVERVRSWIDAGAPDNGSRR